MSQEYSDPKRSSNPYSLPDVEVFQLTATEAAALDEELMHEYGKRHEFRLWSMSSKTREAMLGAIVEEEGIKGGWFWWTCLPGCLPDSDPFGPFESHEEALRDAQTSAGTYYDDDEGEENEFSDLPHPASI